MPKVTQEAHERARVRVLSLQLEWRIFGGCGQFCFSVHWTEWPPHCPQSFSPYLSHPFLVSLLVRGRDVQGRINRSAGRRSAERAPADHQLERTSLRGVRRQARWPCSSVSQKSSSPLGHGLQPQACNLEHLSVSQPLIHAELLRVLIKKNDTSPLQVLYHVQAGAC